MLKFILLGNYLSYTWWQKALQVLDNFFLVKLSKIL